MSERYGKLFSLPENLYTEGSPVVIAAGALLKDNQTGKILAQLKIQNIAPKKIKATTVCIQPLDTVGNPLGDTVTYQYLDLCADRDSEFGQKTPITLPNAATRSFQAFVTEVIFEDNTTWTQEIHPWESLKRVQTLSVLQDGELEMQFRMDYGLDCANLLLEQKDLWHCVCGAVNRQGEANCHKCRKSYADLKAIDMDSLRARKAERVAKEQEHLRTAQAQRAVKAAKNRKIAIVSLGIATFVIIAIVAVTMISGNVKKSNAYDNAVMRLGDGCYGEAIQIFEELGDYKDSIQQLVIAKIMLENEENYNKALEALENGQNELAYQLFQDLTGFKDAEEYLSRFSKLTVLSEEKWFWPKTQDKTIYEYDLQGFLIKKETYNSKGELCYYDLYQYNGKGLLIRDEYYGKNGLVAYTIYQYNDKGFLIQEEEKFIGSNSHYLITYEYDIYGNKISELHYDYGSTDIKYGWYYEYDKYGQTIKETNERGGVTTFDNTYDEQGRLIKRNYKTGFCEYTYNENGLLVQEKEETKSGNDSDVFIMQYQYDSNGTLMTFSNSDGLRIEYNYKDIIMYDSDK